MRLARRGAILAEEGGPTMKEHEFWRHRETGDVYAVVFVDGVVTGLAGPLPVDDRRQEYLPGLDYAGDRAEWAEQHRDAFDVYIPDHGAILQ
jgi:hypothetical protein